MEWQWYPSVERRKTMAYRVQYCSPRNVHKHFKQLMQAVLTMAEEDLFLLLTGCGDLQLQADAGRFPNIQLTNLSQYFDIFRYFSRIF